MAVPDPPPTITRAAQTQGYSHIAGVLIHGILLLSIIIATTLMGLERAINGDAVVGLFGAVAATTAGTTAYRSGVRSGDASRIAERNGD
jgi:hypothetical protein